ncbi:ArnT family glycosyltransferase [Thermomonas sp.]|uniref:ArnT family glycosyltransferase n=1 Tax=Thermomonas sp. TaxID=1971895 RepID=UPI0039E32720
MNSARRWFIGLWVAVLALKLAHAARLPLFVDEAFYWQEGRHLAWAYSDLPGLTAWLARVGDALGQGAFAMRLPFIAISMLVPWLIVRMTAREFDARSGWQAGTLALLLPLSGSLGLMALPDVPMLLASVLCLDAGLRVLRKVDAFAAAELAAGLVIGGLTHYRFAAVIAAGLVALLLLREGRRALCSPLVWGAVVAGALAWLPLLLWNLHNADAGLRFQLMDRHPWSFSGGEGLRLGAVQLLLATPLLLAAMALAAWRGLRDARAAARYLAIGGAVIVLGFIALGFFADRERVSFHWPLPGYLALLPLVPAVLARWSRGWRIATWACAGLALAAVLAWYAAASSPVMRVQMAARGFHPVNFAGWNELADAVRTQLRTMPPGTRVLAGDFKLGAELGFALDDADIAVLDHPLNHQHGRAPQLALWGLQHDGARAAPMLLAVAARNVKFSELLPYYQQLCRQVGPLPAPQVLNIDRGRQRFLLFALQATRSDGPCVTPVLANIDAPAAGALVPARFVVQGWAVKDVVGVRRIDVTLDGRVIARAALAGDNQWLRGFLRGASRDPRMPQVQFRAEVDASGLPPGRHWLGLRITGGDGSVEDWAEQPLLVR